MRPKKLQNTLAAGLACLGFGACTHQTSPLLSPCASQPLNAIQIIGSHNSYRRLPPDSVLAALEKMRPGLREKLEYEHPPLAQQLNLGLRLLELDLYADPEGGLFSDPPNLVLLAEGDPAPFTSEEIAQPSFKVMHIQGYDNYSHCVDLRDCLQQLKSWSDANPDHLLVTVTLNIKEDHIFEDLPVPPKFDAVRLAELDEILFDIFGNDGLLKPDDVRGDQASLRSAVLAVGWPKLEDTARKFMFVLDEAKPSASLVYREGHPSLKGRAMFAHYPAGDDEAAFMVYWDIIGQEHLVADLVSQGFLVRVSADVGTSEARINDTSRLKKAIASGAQFIASDYYPGHISPFATEYLARFDNGGLIQCGAQTLPHSG